MNEGSWDEVVFSKLNDSPKVEIKHPVVIELEESQFIAMGVYIYGDWVKAFELIQPSSDRRDCHSSNYPTFFPTSSIKRIERKHF